MLDMIRRDAFGYFLHETTRANGLVLDKTCRDWPASIAWHHHVLEIGRAADGAAATVDRRRPRDLVADAALHAGQPLT